ncbi:MAG: hypothetical protein WBD36_11295 [Bacteroidota bacterium]
MKYFLCRSLILNLHLKLNLMLILLLFSSCRKDEPCPTCPPNNTADTTSHEFVWTIDTLGDGNISTLNDVAIINDTLAYAVGEIYLKDSAGQIDPVDYNFAKWNGKKWSSHRVPLQLYNFDCTVAGSYFGVTRAIFTFGNGTVVFTDGEDVVLYNGSSFSHLPCSNAARTGGFLKFWGPSLNNLYGVGSNGCISYYNGTSWQKLENGTTVDLLDVWGSPRGTVWAVGYKDFVGTVLLKVAGNVVEPVYDDNLNWFTIRNDSLSGVLTSVWTNSDEKVYAVTPAGLYECPSSTHGDGKRNWFNNTFSPGFPNRVRGQGANDIFVIGDFSFLAHFNGKSWHWYQEIGGSVRWHSVAMRGDLVIGVGVDVSNIFNRGVVAIGKR